jgi:hypothetical protein
MGQRSRANKRTAATTAAAEPVFFVDMQREKQQGIAQQQSKTPRSSTCRTEDGKTTQQEQR